MREIDTLEEREQWFLEYVVKSNRGTIPQHPPFYAGPETAAGGWKQILAAAEEHNAPGRFTTIPAFEWGAAPSGANLRRNGLPLLDGVPATVRERAWPSPIWSAPL